MGMHPFSYGNFGVVPDPPEPPELSGDEFIKSCLMDEYRDDGDFKRFVDKCSVSYGKSLDEILDSPITWEYYISLQKGGCNEERKHGSEDPEGTSAAGASSACDS